MTREVRLIESNGRDREREKRKLETTCSMRLRLALLAHRNAHKLHT